MNTGRGASSDLLMEVVIMGKPYLGMKHRGRGKMHVPPELALQNIEGDIRSLAHEIMIVYNRKGKPVAHFIGNEWGIDIPGSVLGKRYIVTHNHPTGNRGFGGTFSDLDLIVMAHSNWLEMRVVSDGQGEGLYILRRGPNARSEDFKKHVIRVGDYLKQKVDRKYHDVLNEEFGRGADSDRAHHIAAQKSGGIMDRYIKRLAKRYGFEYVKRKIHEMSNSRRSGDFAFF